MFYQYSVTLLYHLVNRIKLYYCISGYVCVFFLYFCESGWSRKFKMFWTCLTTTNLTWCENEKNLKSCCTGYNLNTQLACVVLIANNVQEINTTQENINWKAWCIKEKKRVDIGWRLGEICIFNRLIQSGQTTSSFKLLKNCSHSFLSAARTL